MSQRFDILYCLHYTMIDTLSGIDVTDLTLPKLLWHGREPKQLRFQRRLRAENLSNLKNFFAKNHLKS